VSNSSSELVNNLRQQLAARSAELAQAHDRIRDLEARQICLGCANHPQNLPDSRILAQAVKRSPASIIITDHDGNIEYVNPYFTRLTGYSPHEVIGQNPRILKSGYTSSDEYQQLWATITTGQEWEGEFHNKKKDGSLYWEYARIAPVYGADAQITHFIAIKEDITERKRAVSALQESENRFRTLISSMDYIIFTLDQEGHHTGAYGCWLEAHQPAPDVFLGRTSRDILGDAAQVHETANAQALSGQHVVYEWEAKKQSIQTSLSPIKDNNELVTGLIGIGRDITHLKHVEAQLRLSEAFAYATLDALSAQIAILDEQGTILAVNEAWNTFARENGANLDHVGVGVNYLDAIRAVDPASEDAPTAQAVLEGIQQFINGGLPTFSLEYPCHAPDTRRWFVIRVTRFAGDGPVRVVVAHENVTERVLAEQGLVQTNAQLEEVVAQRTAQLQRLNNRMTTILNHISTPVLLVDGDGHIDVTNTAFNQKLGYPVDALFGQSFWTIFAEKDHASIAEALQSVHQHDVPLLETQLIARDGTRYDVEVSLNAVPDHDGHVVCTLYDISHLKEIERVKDQFISMVNHELRTPITSITLSASTLQQYFDRLPEERKRDKITQILHQAQTLSDLVTAILDLSRFDARHGQRGKDVVDVAQALRDAVDELRPQAETKAQAVDIEISNSVLSLRGEHFDLLRIWRNLLSNAIKYTPKGGHIVVKLCGACGEEQSTLADLAQFAGSLPDDIGAGRYIVGIVNDNGHGMGANDLRHLFTRFYRGWATSTKINGTGLGLALVRDLLRLYGGDIVVSSQLDKGTTFCFWLPIIED